MKVLSLISIKYVVVVGSVCQAFRATKVRPKKSRYVTLLPTLHCGTKIKLNTFLNKACQVLDINMHPKEKEHKF